MKASYVVVAILALAAVGWWAYGHPGYETRAQLESRARAQAQAQEAARPKLYRWHDRNGVLQLADHPPTGRKYQVVDLDAAEGVNVIPMSEAIAPAQPSEQTPAK